MIISILFTVLLLYIAFNTKLDGDRLPTWCFYAIAALTLCSWESAIVMFVLAAYCIVVGVKNGEINTLKWIENLIK
jgi:hypothetical protein